MSSAEAIRPNSTAEKLAQLDGGYASGTPSLESLPEGTAKRQADLKYESDRFEFQQRRAKMFALSGMFRAGKDTTLDQEIGAAMVRIELGEGMGFSPAESMMGINIIGNRPAVDSALRAARMQAAGFGWEFQWHGPEEQRTGLTLWLSYKGKPLLEATRKADGSIVLEEGVPVMQQAHVSFKEPDAERMKTTIWENGNKKRVTLLEKWEHSGGATLEDMYFSKAIVRAQRRYAPAVMSASILSIDEAMEIDSEPVPYTISDKPAEPRKGTASVKEALGIKKGEVMPSESAHGTNSAPGAHATARQGEGVEQARASSEWANLDEMHKAFVQLRKDMVEWLGPGGATEYDNIVREAGGYPKSLEAGQPIFQKIKNRYRDIERSLNS